MLVDHYHTLGVTSAASAEEIRRAYLDVMRTTHPDHRPGDLAAADRAREANAAFEVLGDSARRAAYDRLRTVRAASEQRRGVRVVQRRADANVAYVAYHAERERYRSQVTRALLRVGVGAFAAAFLLLVVVA